MYVYAGLMRQSLSITCSLSSASLVEVQSHCDPLNDHQQQTAVASWPLHNLWNQARTYNTNSAFDNSHYRNLPAKPHLRTPLVEA